MTGKGLRYGIIGCAAGIAQSHLKALAGLPHAQVVGMADINPEKGAQRAREIGCPFFPDHREMLAKVKPDVAVICTPHPFHAALAIDSFSAGAHVLTEKPLAVQVAEGDAMIAAADQAGRLLAVNYQFRFKAIAEQARALIQSGEIGSLIRVLCVEPWFRTAAYYRSASWRGTWEGEGGGVLMNQAPHTMDLLCHLVGLPAKVWGWTRTRYHQMECEDSAQAMFEYPNGAPGYLTVSTVEAGVPLRIQVIGDRGGLEIVGEELFHYHFATPLLEYMKTSPEMWKPPGVRREPVKLEGKGGGHHDVYRDLEQAIREGRQPRANGREALQSLELANAIILSSYTAAAVSLPVDRAAYAALLNDLKAKKR